MKAALAACAILFLAAQPLCAAGLGTPRLSTALESPTPFDPSTARFFDTESFLTNAGMTYSSTQELTLEPEVGFGYHARDQELSGGMEQSTHRLHAQAGWRLSLADTLHLSAAAKIPMLSYDSLGLSSGDELGIRPDLDARHRYQLSNISRSALNWRGELGIHLAPETDLTLYYDQSPVYCGYTGGLQQENRIGTRFILRFK